MNYSPLVIVSVIIGIALVALSLVYFMTPAASLPHFLPGFDPSTTKMHYKHGIGALLLGLGSFAFAWFQSGAKTSPVQDQGHDRAGQ